MYRWRQFRLLSPLPLLKCEFEGSHAMSPAAAITGSDDAAPESPRDVVATTSASAMTPAAASRHSMRRYEVRDRIARYVKLSGAVTCASRAALRRAYVPNGAARNGRMAGP